MHFHGLQSGLHLWSESFSMKNAQQPPTKPSAIFSLRFDLAACRIMPSSPLHGVRKDVCADFNQQTSCHYSTLIRFLSRLSTTATHCKGTQSLALPNAVRTRLSPLRTGCHSSAHMFRLRGQTLPRSKVFSTEQCQRPHQCHSSDEDLGCWCHMLKLY